MVAVRDVQVEPQGDDQPWKREVQRVLSELIARQTADRSDIDILKGRD